MAVRNGVPYAIDFCNPAPDAEVTSVGQENFDWVVEHAAKMAVERAQISKTWSGQSYVGNICNELCDRILSNPEVAKPKPRRQHLKNKIKTKINAKK
jgi:hypothetical protein